MFGGWRDAVDDQHDVEADEERDAGGAAMISFRDSKFVFTFCES